MGVNLETLRTLVGLRYRLLWAQARTGRGRVTLFLTLYLIGGCIIAFFVLGGFGAAAVAVQTGRAEMIARAVLSGIFINGIIGSLALGVGPRAAFADRVLRRFPLTAAQRFTARHIIGILDPIWLFLAAITLGLATGLAALGACSILIALPAAVLFVAVAYLIAALLLTIVERLLQHRGGELLLTVIMLAFFAGLGFAVPLLAQAKARAWWPLADRLLQLTPAGTAGTLLSSPNTPLRVLSTFVLIAWGVALWFALRFAETWVVRRPNRDTAPVSWDSAYDALARVLHPAQAPLFARALRYNLRCNRVRYQLAISVPLVLFLEVLYRLQHVGGTQRGVATLGFVFMLGIFSTLAMAVNQFGYDAAGVRRYPMLPLPMSAVLRAQARVTLFLASCAIVPGVAIWCFMRGSALAWRGVVFVLADAFAGLLLFGAAGLWTSVLTPKRAEFDRVMGNDMSIGGNIILFVCVFVMSAVGPLAHHYRVDDLAAHWPLMLLGTVVAALLYVASLLFAGRLLDQRRERVLVTIAGAAQN